MTITKIVITGGPSAGKTTGMSWIQNAFTKLGYTVLFVPETATELISGGVCPWTCGTNLEYQKCQMRLQLEKERLFEQAARTMKAERILIVCDRGAIDNKAYMNDEEFAAVLADVGKTEQELRDGYDAVFHMVTAAKGAEQFYTFENNAARYESVQEACALDDRLIASWTGHRHFRVIDNSIDFHKKLQKLIGEIRAFLGEPEPPARPRKYLIRRPDALWLENLPDCRKSEILSTYLMGPRGEEVRVRQRGENGSFSYSRIATREPEGEQKIIVEERLTQDEYLNLLMQADPAKRPVRKTRYSLNWEGRPLEIDLFPFWEDQALMRLEHGDAEARPALPEGLEILREVTGEPEYKNAGLARRK